MGTSSTCSAKNTKSRFLKQEVVIDHPVETYSTLPGGSPLMSRPYVRSCSPYLRDTQSKMAQRLGSTGSATRDVACKSLPQVYEVCVRLTSVTPTTRIFVCLELEEAWASRSFLLVEF